MAKLWKAFERVGTRVHKREPNLKNWTIRKVVAGPVRLTTFKCLTKVPSWPSPPREQFLPRRPLWKPLCSASTQALVEVRVSGPDAALPQRLELGQTGIQLSCRPLPTFRLVSVRAMVLNIGTLVVGLDSDLASFMIAWSGGSINGD